jgi:hypothetical protein
VRHLQDHLIRVAAGRDQELGEVGLGDRGDAGVVGTSHRYQQRASRIQYPYDVRVPLGLRLVRHGVRVTGRQPPAGLPGDGVLAHRRELGAAAYGVIVDELAQVGVPK